jgi:isopentenyl diphosphate isomerase/L-lactate dehydrogenase-like FMN-dependent dehydrogenase
MDELTLEDIRNKAREKLKGVCGVYKICDGASNKICQNQSYGAPIGMGGVGSGAAFAANIKALEKIGLKTRLVGEHLEPDTSVTILGKTVSMPIMGASVAGVGSFGNAMTEEAFCLATVLGCQDAGTFSFRGDTYTYTLENTPGLDAIAEAGGLGVKICKPRDQETLFQLFKKAEQIGAIAVGVDLDGCGSTNMARHNQPVFRKTFDEIRALVASTSLPFIAKGIMCVEDALAAVEAGAAAISVSNHGGRVQDCTPGVAEVLPEIASKVKGKITVFADGGIRTGYDVLKMLALGADAVLVGRDLIRAAVGAGREGVRLHMGHLRSTLAKAMLMTGCSSIRDITSEIFC